MQGKGFVVNAQTKSERRQEIDKWYGDPWYFTLANLDVRLERLDPNYIIVQIKEKFGRLTFYFQTSDSSKRAEMQSAVNNAERLAMEADKQQTAFDKYAVPAPSLDNKFEW